MFTTDGISAVQLRKTAEVVATQIRNAIVRGELRTGAILPKEEQLSIRFGVSRPTTREAIRILESENLLQVMRGARGGARVCAPKTELVARAMGLILQVRGTTLGDIYKARMIIEPPAARLAAETRPQEAAQALRAHILYEEQQLSQHGTMAKAITDFHRILVEQSGNQTLSLVIDALNEMSERHLALVHRSHQEDDLAIQLKRRRKGLKSNAKLADLIAAGDGVGAEDHWRSHMLNVGEYWLKTMESRGLDILD